MVYFPHLSVMGAGLWEILEHASHHLLKEKCSIVPAQINIKAVLMNSSISHVDGFDLSCLNQYLWHPYHKKVRLDRYNLNEVGVSLTAWLGLIWQWIEEIKNKATFVQFCFVHTGCHFLNSLIRLTYSLWTFKGMSTVL